MYAIRSYYEFLNLGEYKQEVITMFELVDAENSTAIIKVIGVGGGGGNASYNFV